RVRVLLRVVRSVAPRRSTDRRVGARRVITGGGVVDPGPGLGPGPGPDDWPVRLPAQVPRLEDANSLKGRVPDRRVLRLRTPSRVQRFQLVRRGVAGGGAVAAEEGGPGGGEHLDHVEAGEVDVVDDGDLVALLADLPAGAARLQGAGLEPDWVQEAVGLVEVVLPAQKVQVLDAGRASRAGGAAQELLDVVAL